MKITKPPWMPDILYKSIVNQQESYDKGDSDFTVTELIGPAWQGALKRKHHTEIEESADDRIWSLIGSSIHAMIQQANGAGVAEKRFFIRRMGYVISGQADYINYQVHKGSSSSGFSKTIYDWKMTSGYAVIDGPKKEWGEQLNLLNLLYSNQESLEHQVTDLKVIAFYKDWSERNYLNNPLSYPKRPYGEFVFSIWTPLEAEEFLLTKIQEHIEADAQVGGKRLSKHLLCTPEERWSKPDKYAVKKIGNKSATKLFDKEKDADNFIGGKPMGERTYEIEYRPGEDTRCMKYCNVNKFCPHYQTLIKQEIKEAA
jgi:hypothetical protein